MTRKEFIEMNIGALETRYKLGLKFYETAFEDELPIANVIRNDIVNELEYWKGLE